MVPSLLQEATCSDFGIIFILLYFRICKCTVFLLNKHFHPSLSSKVLSQFSVPVAAIYSMSGPFFDYKRTIMVMHSFKFTLFLQYRNFSKDIFILIMIPHWFQAYILKEVCYLTTSVAAIHFFCGSVINS